jgi:hypothetical protein
MSSTDQFTAALAGRDIPRIKIVHLPIHLFPSADSQSFDFVNYVALPAVGAQAVVVSFPVPDGQNGIIWRFGNAYVGTGFTEGSGSLQWQLLEDGVPITNYENIVASLGATANPSAVAFIRVKESSLVQLVINNISLVVGGASSGGRIGGWFYPKDQEPETAWP